jgi:hypothetical protein
LTFKSSTSQATSPARIYVHLLQLLPQKRFTNLEYKYIISIGEGSYGDGNGEEQIEKKRFAVRGGRTLEVW